MANELDGRRVAVVGPRWPALADAIADGLVAAGARLVALDPSSSVDAPVDVAVDVPVDVPVDVVVHVGPEPSPERPLVDTDESTWDELAEAPARELLATLQAAHAALTAAGGGRIIVVVPSVAMEGAAGLVAGTTGWEAMRLLAKSAARRWGRDGITVNVVAPRIDGPPDAVRTAPVLDAEHSSTAAVVDGVVLLASDRAAHFTGATLQADGGALMLP